jgi:GT2 family glycosyltransferase
MTRLIAVIPTFDRPQLLQRTLASLSGCERPAGFARTIVVENGAPAGAESIARMYGAEYLHVPLANKSHALNRVLEHVGDALLYFSDDDVRFHPNVLNAIAAAARNETAGEFFGGSVQVDFEEAPPDWLIPLLPKSAAGWDVGDDESWSRDPWFLGSNWAAFSADLRRVGGFDARFGPGSVTSSTGQERVMQERLRRAGVRPVRVPEAVVWHWVPRDRCQPEWIVQRRRRSGVSVGLRLRSAQSHGRLTPIVPWWGLARSLPATALRWASGGRRGRLMARRELHYRLGVIAGFHSFPPVAQARAGGAERQVAS